MPKLDKSSGDACTELELLKLSVRKITQKANRNMEILSKQD